VTTCSNRAVEVVEMMTVVVVVVKVVVVVRVDEEWHRVLLHRI